MRKMLFVLVLLSAFLFMVGCSNSAGVLAAGDGLGIITETVTVTEETFATGGVEDGIDVSFYSLEMNEKPVDTLWEIVSNHVLEPSFHLAKLVPDNDQFPIYDVMVYCQEDAGSSNSRCFIEVVSDESKDSIFVFEVSKENIDEIWLNFEAGVIFYNTVFEQAMSGFFNSDTEEIYDVCSVIYSFVEDYLTNGFAVTENVAAAGMNEDDWLRNFLANHPADKTE